MRMASGVRHAPPAPPQKRPTPKPSSADAPPHQMATWRASAIILLAFFLVGIIPVGIVAHATGQPRFTLPSSITLFAGATSTAIPTDAPDLALPRDAWATRSVDVLPNPAQGTALATLAADFPVKVLQHQRVGNTIWSRVEWTGPVNGTGGAGWVPDTALISYGTTGAILGDLGALAPTLRQAVAPYAKQFTAAVYIPSQNRLYSAGAVDDVFALGTGLRPMLLSALFSGAQAQNQSVSLTDELSLSHGDANGTLRIYQQLGGANSLSLYLSSHNIAGFQTAPVWTACYTTTRAMTDYYAQLAGALLPAKARSSTISILSLADAPTTTNLVLSWARAAGNLLVVGIAPTDNTFTVSVAGILSPKNGPQMIVVAVATAQPSTDAALQTMKAFYTPLTTMFAG